jgi:hypothetical protein
MKHFFAAIAAAVLSCVAWADPKADGNALLLPTYIFEQNPPVSAGFAYVFEEAGQRYAATAYHVFGPPGGLRRELSARELPEEVKALAGICMGRGNTVIVAQPALYVEGARAMDAAGAEADVAFFRVPDVRAKAAFRLATIPAKPGDRVWLFARLMDRVEARLYPAKIVVITPKVVRYQFENPALNLVACSGAPVLDEFGVVAAMHLGYVKQGDELSGLAVPASALRERFNAAAGLDR